MANRRRRLDKPMLELVELIDFVATIAGCAFEILSWVGGALEFLDHLRTGGRRDGPHDAP